MTDRKPKEAKIKIKANNPLIENIIHKRRLTKENKLQKIKIINKNKTKVEINSNKNLNQRKQNILNTEIRSDKIKETSYKNLNNVQTISDYIKQEISKKKSIRKTIKKVSNKRLNKNINNNRNINIEESKKEEKNNSDIEMNLLESDNEFNTSNTIESKNLQVTQFPELSINPFSTKCVNTNLAFKNESINIIPDIKYNFLQTDKNVNIYKPKNNNINDSSTLLNKSDYNSHKLNLSNDSSNISNSTEELNINSEISEKTKEQIYKKLLLLSKRGDNEKFFNIFQKIISLQKQTNININYQDENGYTALHYACDEGNLKIVDILLNANCDPNIKNNLNQTPLHLSTQRGYFDITKKLIESGAKLNIEDSENNYPIHFICKNNYIELLKYILTKSIQINCKNKYGKTPRDLTTNSEIINILDNYIKKNKDKLNNKIRNKIKISKSLKIDNSKDNNLIKKNRLNKTNTTISKEKKDSPIYQSNNELNTINESSDSNKNKKIYIFNDLLNNTSTKNYKTENSNMNLNQAINGNLYNTNTIIKKEQKYASKKNHECIKKPILYFKNTNNINNKNININFFSIEIKKKFSLNHYIKNLIKENLNEKSSNNSKNKLSNGVNDYFNKTHVINTKRALTYRYDHKVENCLDISNNNDDKNYLIINEKGENSMRGSKLKKNIIELNNIINNIDILSNNNKINDLNSKEKTLPKKRKSDFKSQKNLLDNFIKNNNNNNIKINTKSIEQISLKDFICLAQLGKGSFGQVYLVEKINTKEKFAMKVLNKEKILRQNLLKYAIAERNILSNNNHPFIVKLNYSFQTSSKLFLIIEYCPNSDLSKHLIKEKRFIESRAKFYICELILALEYLHKKDIIFRDLKPSNILLDKDGHIKLIDFGLSKEGVNDDIYAKSFCGSIGYFAPEILLKQGYGKSVDWYSLGIIFYEMLFGTIPRFTFNKEEIIKNLNKVEINIPNFISKEAAELIKKLLDKNPNERLGGGGRDAIEIKENIYFKDVDWNKIYEKEIKPPNYLNYTNSSIKYFNKPKKFVNEDLLDNNKNQNIVEDWYFERND